MKVAAVLALISTFLLSACGGGGGGAVPPPPPPPQATLSGQFKDSNVQGLSYSTASLSGTTDSLGTFSYRAGETVEFSIGGIVIGDAPGAMVITPLDLVAGGSSSNAEVINVTRFLLLLDENENPSDGVQVSAAVRQAAVNWAQVDFTTPDLDNELVTIISDVASADARAASLPGNPLAMAHVESTVRCVMSGVFQGTRTIAGSDAGGIVFLLNPETGVLLAGYTGNTENFSSVTPIPVDQQISFGLNRQSNADTIDGTFDSLDELSGVWSINGQSGEFTAVRLYADSSAIFRFSGQFSDGTIITPRLSGIYGFNIAANGDLSGGFFKLSSSVSESQTGSLSASEINSVGGNGSMITGMVSPSLAVEGTWAIGSASTGVWNGQGCKLN